MMILNILLQASNETIPWQRLFDGGLTLGILGIVAKVLWSKVKTLEDRQAKYIEEDRKEMLEVIKDNTKAFNRLNDNLERLPKQ